MSFNQHQGTMNKRNPGTQWAGKYAKLSASVKEALAKLDKLSRRGHGDYFERKLLHEAIELLKR
jgi:hypothetical protein